MGTLFRFRRAMTVCTAQRLLPPALDAAIFPREENGSMTLNDYIYQMVCLYDWQFAVLCKVMDTKWYSKRTRSGS
jgi:hypothetical protein